MEVCLERHIVPNRHHVLGHDLVCQMNLQSSKGRRMWITWSLEPEVLPRGDHWAKIVEQRAIKNRVQYVHCR
jgi:hypothetical protein